MENADPIIQKQPMFPKEFVEAHQNTCIYELQKRVDGHDKCLIEDRNRLDRQLEMIHQLENKLKALDNKPVDYDAATNHQLHIAMRENVILRDENAKLRGLLREATQQASNYWSRLQEIKKHVEKGE